MPASNSFPPSRQQQIQQQQQQQQQHQHLQQQQQPREPLPLYLSQPFIRSTIVTGNFKTLVTLPRYIDPNEWVGVNSESIVGRKGGREGGGGS